MVRSRYSYRTDPAVPAFPDDRDLVVFDGDCALCSALARMILRRDRRGRFRVAPALSPLGRALYAHFGLDPQDPSSMLLLQDGRAVLRSDAVIAISEGLGGVGRLATVARVVPRSWRDAAYGWVAHNRLRFQTDAPRCALTPEADPDRILQ
jgi:predicted DCC family thiol-disulfide oxidoreductase YuxK